MGCLQTPMEMQGRLVAQQMKEMKSVLGQDVHNQAGRGRNKSSRNKYWE